MTDGVVSLENDNRKMEVRHTSPEFSKFLDGQLIDSLDIVRNGLGVVFDNPG